MHSIESRFVTGPSNILFAGVYMSIIQPGKFTGWGREGVKSGPEKEDRQRTVINDLGHDVL